MGEGEVEPTRVAVRVGGTEASAAGQVALGSAFGFDETVVRLKSAIAAEDLWIIAEIDPQMLLRKGGYAVPPTRQILFFHPRFMARLLSTNAAGIVEAPLKVVVMEMAGGEMAGGRVAVRYPEPGPSFARHEGLAALGDELGLVVARIVRSIAPSRVAA